MPLGLFLFHFPLAQLVQGLVISSNCTKITPPRNLANLIELFSVSLGRSSKAVLMRTESKTKTCHLALELSP